MMRWYIWVALFFIWFCFVIFTSLLVEGIDAPYVRGGVIQRVVV